MTYIERLKHDIQRVDDAIDFCKDVGDKPEDFADLTDERAALVSALDAALADAKLVAARGF